jgi:hypothetical protein
MWLVSFDVQVGAPVARVVPDEPVPETGVPLTAGVAVATGAALGVGVACDAGARVRLNPKAEASGANAIKAANAVKYPRVRSVRGEAPLSGCMGTFLPERHGV